MGGLFSKADEWFSKIDGWFSKIDGWFSKMGGWFSSWFSKKEIPRPSLIEGVPGRGKVVYKREVVHSADKKPYTFRFAHPTATITGIACTPVKDEQIQSPEATVTEGGLNRKHVYIYLEPTQKGPWAYQLAISVEEPTSSYQAGDKNAAAGATGGGGGGGGGASSDESKNYEKESSNEKQKSKESSRCSIL